METILMRVKVVQKSPSSIESLNPFYIMETILIYEAITEEVKVSWVLIHSTSWKLFWSYTKGGWMKSKVFNRLNPFYIMETILILKADTANVVYEISVLIHSTSWKLFWWIRNTGETMVIESSLNPFYIMETILIRPYWD